MRFAPKAPPRRVPKPEVKTYVIMIICLNRMYVPMLYFASFKFCHSYFSVCSEVVEDADANANAKQARELLRRFNVYVLIKYCYSSLRMCNISWFNKLEPLFFNLFFSLFS